MKSECCVVKLENECNEIKTLFENETEEKDLDLVNEILELTNSIEDYRKYVEITKHEVKFKHHVGVIQTENYRIQILPKIWNDKRFDFGYINSNLFKLLMYAYASPKFDLPELSIDVNKTEFDLFEMIIAMYCKTLSEELKHGTYRRYKKVSYESSFLRGSLRLKDQLTKVDQSRFDVDDFIFTSDNDLNRFFLYANRKFKEISTNESNTNLLNFIDIILNSENVAYEESIKEIHFNRLNERFKIPYTCARIVLDGLLPRTGRGNSKTMMMLFDMNIVFELFFSNFIERNKNEIFYENGLWNILIQSSKRNFIFNKEGVTKRYTKPDLIAYNKNLKYIFDTKYKILETNGIIEIDELQEDLKHITSSDLYQAYVYSELYGSTGTFLVFPGSKNELSEPYKFTENGKLLWVLTIKVDLNEIDWEKQLVNELKKKLLSIVNG